MSAIGPGRVKTTGKYGTGKSSAWRSAGHSLAAAAWHFGQCRLPQDILWCARSTSVASSARTGLRSARPPKLGAHVNKRERGTTLVYRDRFIPHRERLRAAEDGDEPE